MSDLYALFNNILYWPGGPKDRSESDKAATTEANKLHRQLSWLRVGSQMQEVWGSNPRPSGLRVSQFQASGGISTLQSRASGLQSTTQGNSIRTERSDGSERLVNRHRSALLLAARAPQCNISEGGMIRLETLIALKFINSSFSSLSSYWNSTNHSLKLQICWTGHWLFVKRRICQSLFFAIVNVSSLL